jgi:D-amino-acid dehydrogenase
MKVIVLGSGVIGVSTGYFLARSGHEVSVVDRRPGPAQETSYANAGEISPGYAAPWAGPGAPLKALKWMRMAHPPLVVHPSLDGALWRWMGGALANCTAARYRTNKGRMVRLAEYSRDCLADLRAETGIRYDGRGMGTLQLFRTWKQLDAAAGDTEVLLETGLPFQLLDSRAVLRYEPALDPVRHKFVGGLRLPGDETGDCYKFSVALARLAEGQGVRFRLGTRIGGLARNGGRIDGVQTESGLLQADAYVVALGSYSPLLLKPLGLDLPIYPVKGYSISVPVADPARAPKSTLMDETYKVALTRLGSRIRVGGTAELAGYDLSLPETRRATLAHVLGDLFPGAADGSPAEFWTGLRPMTPDGPPILGATPYANLYLNTGHGTLGWTMAAGTGKLLADLLSRRRTEIDMEGLTLARYDSRKIVSRPAARGRHRRDDAEALTTRTAM